MSQAQVKDDPRVWFYVRSGLVRDEDVGPLTNKEMNLAIQNGKVKRKTKISNAKNRQQLYFAENIWPGLFEKIDQQKVAEKQKQKDLKEQERQLKLQIQQQEAEAHQLALQQERVLHAGNLASDFRVWKSADATFSVEARMAAFSNGIISLQQRDGSTIQVSTEQISNEDRSFLGLGQFAIARLALPQSLFRSFRPLQTLAALGSARRRLSSA